MARAESEANVTMGEGDAQAARIYAEAYGEAPQFYAFLRSLEAYRKTLGSGTTMVLPSDHEIEFYLRDEGQAGRVVVDGQVSRQIVTDEKVRIRKAKQPFIFIRVGLRSYYSRLRKILGWGGGPKYSQ